MADGMPEPLWWDNVGYFGVWSVWCVMSGEKPDTLTSAQREQGLRRRGLGDTLDAVTLAYGVTSTDILRRCRHAAVVRARHCLCWRLVHLRGLSTVEVMHLVGRDKSTVWDAVERHWWRIRDGLATEETVTYAGEAP